MSKHNEFKWECKRLLSPRADLHTAVNSRFLTPFCLYWTVVFKPWYAGRMQLSEYWQMSLNFDTETRSYSPEHPFCFIIGKWSQIRITLNVIAIQNLVFLTKHKVRLPLTTILKRQTEVISQLHAPVAFTPEKELRYILNRRLGGPQSRSVRFGGKKCFLPLPVFEIRTLQTVAWQERGREELLNWDTVDIRKRRATF